MPENRAKFEASFYRGWAFSGECVGRIPYQCLLYTFVLTMPRLLPARVLSDEWCVNRIPHRTSVVELSLVVVD